MLTALKTSFNLQHERKSFELFKLFNDANFLMKSCFSAEAKEQASIAREKLGIGKSAPFFAFAFDGSGMSESEMLESEIENLRTLRDADKDEIDTLNKSLKAVLTEKQVPKNEWDSFISSDSSLKDALAKIQSLTEGVKGYNAQIKARKAKLEELQQASKLVDSPAVSEIEILEGEIENLRDLRDSAKEKITPLREGLEQALRANNVDKSKWDNFIASDVQLKKALDRIQTLTQEVQDYNAQIREKKARQEELKEARKPAAQVPKRELTLDRAMEIVEKAERASNVKLEKPDSELFSSPNQLIVSKAREVSNLIEEAERHRSTIQSNLREIMTDHFFEVGISERDAYVEAHRKDLSDDIKISHKASRFKVASRETGAFNELIPQIKEKLIELEEMLKPESRLNAIGEKRKQLMVLFNELFQSGIITQGQLNTIQNKIKAALDLLKDFDVKQRTQPESVGVILQEVERQLVAVENCQHNPKYIEETSAGTITPTTPFPGMSPAPQKPSPWAPEPPASDPSFVPPSASAPPKEKDPNSISQVLPDLSQVGQKKPPFEVAPDDIGDLFDSSAPSVGPAQPFQMETADKTTPPSDKADAAKDALAKLRRSRKKKDPGESE